MNATLKTRDIDRREYCAPAVPDGDAIVFHEPGRVLDNKSCGGHTDVCYQAFHYMVTRSDFGRFTLRRRSGLGDKAWPIAKEAVVALGMLSSDARFFMLHTIADAHEDSRRDGERETANRYRQAFVDGTLKKKKRRGQELVDVWIDSAPNGVGA